MPGEVPRNDGANLDNVESAERTKQWRWNLLEFWSFCHEGFRVTVLETGSEVGIMDRLWILTSKQLGGLTTAPQR